MSNAKTIILAVFAGLTLAATVNAQFLPPEVAAESAIDVTPTSAGLRGRLVEDRGHDCYCRFRYKRSSDGPFEWDYTDWVGPMREGTVFGRTVRDLDPDTSYTYQSRAQYSWNWGFISGTEESEWSAERTFRTLPLLSLIHI